MKRLFWIVLLMIACSLFLVGLETNHIGILLLALVMGVTIRIFGFHAFDKQNTEKRTIDDKR